MFYAPYRRTRKAVSVYLIIVAGCVLSTVAILLFTHPHIEGAGTGHGHEQSIFGAALSALAYCVAGLATALGLNLAADGDGHLEFVLTRPVSRERYAVVTALIDVCGMLIAYLISIPIVLVLIATIASRTMQAVDPPSLGQLGEAVLALGFPLLIYAWVLALSAARKSGRGLVAGLIWPGMLLVAAIGTAPIPIRPQLLWLNEHFNPIVMYTQTNGILLAPQVAAGGFILAIALIAIAVGQWHRLEA
ncbi:MAG: hypothetical protein WCE44_13350 [Candidatus Velthaea sp.]|jgi:hypothetical protein